MKQKLKICIGCGLKKPIWSKGRCLGCSGYQPLAKKPFVKKFKKKEGGGYSDFYKSQIEKYSQHPYSLATGEYIATVGTVNIAHIFPKSDYKSVSKEPQNIILLTWEEHTRFDDLLNIHDFSTLEEEFGNCWLEVCRRVEILVNLVTEKKVLVNKLKAYLDYD